MLSRILPNNVKAKAKDALIVIVKKQLITLHFLFIFKQYEFERASMLIKCDLYKLKINYIPPY